jgi:RNA polymerase sigma-70 factor (ECF subfamily)
MEKKHSKEDAAALAAFVRDHQGGLRAFLRMIGVVRDAVGDLAQETFLVAYREWGAFDPDQDLGKWLRGVARNLVRNELRKSARRTRLLQEEVTQHLLQVSESTPDGPEFEERDFRALRDCVEQLPQMSRKLVSGRYCDEWNASFLAEQLQMSATAVRLALMRIRRQLKSCIEERLAYE